MNQEGAINKVVWVFLQFNTSFSIKTFGPVVKKFTFRIRSNAENDHMYLFPFFAKPSRS